MVKHIQKLLFSLLLLVSTNIFSQVANYTFSETVGTYTPIVGGTQLVTTTAGATAYDTDGSYFTLPAGSQFTYNGTLVTSINMTADGAIWLNPSLTTTGNGTTGPLSSTATATGVIAALAMDLRSTSLASQVYERRWQDVGTEVVFQWQNAARYLSNTTERFSFQVRINKTSGVIQVVYGNMTTIANSTTYQPMVGLRGTTNTDYNNRRLTTTVPDATPNWGAPNGTTAGTSNAHTCRFISTASCFPSSGLIFIWTPPSCVAPTALTITYTSSTSANLSWTTPSPAPSNGYNWEIRTSGLGGSGATGLVASGSVGAGVTSASTSSLSPSTTYTLYVRSNCGGSFSAWSASASSTSPVTAPSNDACSNATSLPCATSGLAGTTVGTISETAPLAYSSPFGVWYSFVGDGLSTTITSVAGAGFDHEMTIMSGTTCGATYTLVTSQDVGLSGGTETFTFNSVNGTQYYIYIAYYGTTGTSTNTGTFTMSRTCTTPIPPPANDACSNAVSLPCATTNLAGTTVGSVSETAPLGYSSPYGVWYTFVGDGNQTTISTYSDMDVEMTIMTGSGCAGFAIVSSQDSWGTFSTESYTFSSINGQRYYIYIAHYSTTSTTTGTFTISRSCVVPCFTSPSTISVNKTSTVTNDNATYTVTGGDGLVTAYQYSFDNFTTIAGTITTTSNPWQLTLNTTNSIVYVRAVTQNGTCNTANSNIVSTTLRCATPFTYTTSYGDYITNVTFNTINNTSTNDGSGDGYQDFLSQSTNVCKGLPYTISVSGTNAGAYLGFAVWVDWNNDNDFDDVGESVLTSGPLATATGTITIPSTAVSGNVKMRVLGAYNQTPSSTPCNTLFLTYGEIEEYTINIGDFTLTTPLVNTDRVFIGRTSNAYATTTNWLQYNGSSLILATSAPTSATNVILPGIQTCMSKPLTIAASTIAEAKSVTIETSGELRLNGTLSVFKNFKNYGLVTNTNTTSQRMLEFVGTGTQDTLVMVGNNTLYNLRVNKTSGEVLLDDTINITNNLDLPSGYLNLNQKVVNLGTTGFLSNEGAGHSTYCDCSQSYVQYTTTIGSSVTTTPGNMGLEITTNGNQMGSTIVRRRHQRAGSTGITNLFTTHPSVYRIFEVVPQFNGTNYPPSGLNVNLKFTYLTHEMGPEIVADESTFTIWRSGNQGVLWEEKGGTIDLINHSVTLTGFPQFSWVSVGPSAMILPLNLLSFNGMTEDNINKLNWVTDNEVNVSHFELEKSVDGINFRTIGTIPSNQFGSGRNYYNFNDDNPFPNTNYYRLKTIDIDGMSYKSNIVALENDGQIEIGKLYPNPTNDIIRYNYTSAMGELIEVKVLDLVGKVLLKKEFDLQIGFNSSPISLSELPSGSYMISITHISQGITNSTKVIKQ